MSSRDLAVQLGGQVSSLVRDEIALAKAELVTDARQAAMGGGLLSGSAVVGHTAWLTAAAAAVAGLSLVLPVWAAALIVAGVLAVRPWAPSASSNEANYAHGLKRRRHG